jgi:uncharacterized membrane protein YkoI
MRSSDVEAKIKNAVERSTPNVLENILEKCEKQQQQVYVFPPTQTKRHRRHWVTVAGSCAAALLLVLGGLLTYNLMSANSVDALVMLDVNPSIELQVNKADRVVAVKANNEEALQILDNMDLTNTEINVAINALVGSMLKYGYIQESKNSVLLSVEGANGEKNARLQKELTQAIGLQLGVANGAVISQSLDDNSALRKLADQYQISDGKAALVQKIIDEDQHLQFIDLAKLSINELNLLFTTRNIQAEGIESQGRASDTSYIGESRAVQAALEHLGIGENEIVQLHTELDYEDGAMVYDVEFTHNGRVYEYEINALNGSIVGYEQEATGGSVSQNNASTPRATPNTENLIDEERAKEIVETHSGFKLGNNASVTLDYDDGRYTYEVEFFAENKEYDYEIDAITGEVLSSERDD